ncbi:MAG: hypothetical protein LBU32_11185 [Clostridiales bacterium]|jgi:V/A-type H+-transporting ATPase subunit E|nr:hypothetical protein [Clostridiales bacterium]
MTGLDKIIEEIIADAKKEAGAMLSQARRQADEIEEKALEEAKALAASAESRTSKQLDLIKEAFESNASLKRRQELLEAKQAILGETLEKARLRLLSLPDDEYFSLCLQIAAKKAEAGQGEIIFNARDKARLPKDFSKRLEEALPDGSSLSISDETRSIDGGFLILYGENVENCSLKSIFRDMRDEFVDIAKDALFRGVS